MIKIPVPSDYKKIKNNSVRYVYICFWAWGYMEFKKASQELERSPDFKHYTPSFIPLKKQKSETSKRKDKDISPLNLLLSLSPPSGPFVEKKFLKTFHIGRTTFTAALNRLEEDKYLTYESSVESGKKLLDKKRAGKIKKLRNDIKQMMKEPSFLERSRILQKLSIDWRLANLRDPKKDFDLFFIDWLYRYLDIWEIEAKGIKKKRLYIYVTTRKARLIKLRFSYDQLGRNSIIQIPLNILTRKDLSIAEKIVGIELYRMKKEEKLNMQRRGNRSYMYSEGKRIKMEDLAKKIEFGKPTVIKTLKKLWY